MIPSRPSFPRSAEDKSQMAKSLKQRAFQMAAKARELDETEADFSQYQPGRVRTEDTFEENGKYYQVKESLTFDPETKEVVDYHYLMNSKDKNDEGQTYREQYQVRLGASDNWMIGSEGQTKLEHSVSETWYEEGIGYDGADSFDTILYLTEKGQDRLIVDHDSRGSYGQGSEMIEEFIVA